MISGAAAQCAGTLAVVSKGISEEKPNKGTAF